MKLKKNKNAEKEENHEILGDIKNKGNYMIFKKIYENTFEYENEKHIIKQRKSKSSNPLSNNKLAENIIYRKRTENFEINVSKQISSFYQLKIDNKINENKTNKEKTSCTSKENSKIINIKETNNSDNCLEKNDSRDKRNLGFSKKNFILKSELYKNNLLSKKEKEESCIDILLTKKIKHNSTINNNNQLYKYFYDNNKNEIISNIYLENEYENKGGQNIINNENGNNKNNNNCLDNYYRIPKNTEEEHPTNNNSTQNEIKTNNISENIGFSNINKLGIQKEKNIMNNNNFGFYTDLGHGINNPLISNYAFNQNIIFNQINHNLNSYYNNNTYLNKRIFDNNNQYNNQYLNMYNIYNPNIFNSTNINKYYNFNDDEKLSKSAMILIKSQSGCQLLKQKCISNPTFANNKLFPEIRNNLREICCDFIGNLLIETLFDLLTYENIDLFLSITKIYFYDICLSEPGSRGLQKLIDKIQKYPILLNKFISNLNNKDIGLLFNSTYGNHILQKYLSTIKKKEFTNFIYQYIFNNFLKIVKNKHGVCVIEKSLSEADNEQRRQIHEIIYKNIDFIMKDDFGSFLINYIFTKLEKKNFEEILPLIRKIEENIVNYCQNKNSGFVIEKCLERGDQKICEHFIKYLFQNHPNSIIDIVANRYGFYVIKKIKYLKNNKLVKEIMKNIVNNIEKINQTNKANEIILSFSFEFKDFSDLLFEKNKKSQNCK